MGSSIPLNTGKNFKELHETPRNSRKPHETPGNSWKLLKTPENSRKLQETPEPSLPLIEWTVLATTLGITASGLISVIAWIMLGPLVS